MTSGFYLSSSSHSAESCLLDRVGYGTLPGPARPGPALDLARSWARSWSWPGVWTRPSRPVLSVLWRRVQGVAGTKAQRHR